MVALLGFSLVSFAETYGLSSGEEMYNTALGYSIDLNDKVPIAADIVPDVPGEELVFVGYAGTFYQILVVNGSTGQLIGTPILIPEPAILSIIGTPCAGDFNGDNFWDIAVTRTWKSPSGFDLVVGHSQVNIFYGAPDGSGLDGTVSTSPTFDVSSPTLVARDVNGDLNDELFLTGISQLVHQQVELNNNRDYTIWSLRYAAMALESDFNPLWGPIYIGQEPYSPDYKYSAVRDNQTQVGNPPHYSAIERSMPVITHENGAEGGNYVLSMFTAFPRVHNNFQTFSFTYHDKIKEVVLIDHLDAQNGLIFHQDTVNWDREFNPESWTRWVRHPATSLDLSTGWENRPYWTQREGAESNSMLGGCGAPVSFEDGVDNCIAIGMWETHFNYNPLTPHGRYNSMMHFLVHPGSSTAQEIVRTGGFAYGYRENLKTSSSKSLHLDGGNNELENPETVSFGMASAIMFGYDVEGTDGYTYAGMNWISHSGIPGSGVTGPVLPPHYRTWFRNRACESGCQFSPVGAPNTGDNATNCWFENCLQIGHDIDPDPNNVVWEELYPWLHDTDLPQASLVSFDRPDIGLVISNETEGTPKHYTRYATIVPDPLDDYEEYNSRWRFQIRNVIEDFTGRSDTIAQDGNGTTGGHEFRVGDYPFSPAPVLFRDADNNMGIAGIFPNENGVEINAYKMRQLATDGQQESTIPYVNEWMQTTQPYQNPRHTGCAWEIWRDQTITTPTTWSGRIYAQDLVIQAPLILTPGTVVEFRPGTEVTCRVGGWFGFSSLTEADIPVLYNRDPDSPVTIIIESLIDHPLLVIGRVNGLFRFVFRNVGGTDPNDPTHVTFASPLQGNPAGNTIELIDCENLVLDGIRIDGTGSGTGIYVEKCPSTVTVQNSKITNVFTGVSLAYASVKLIADTLAQCGKFGINWSHDFPSSNKFGFIDHCVIENNGTSGSNTAGFLVLAAKPTLICNTFDNNYDHAALIADGAAPTFVGAANSGANYFHGVANQAIISITDGYPVFAIGKNQFVLDNSKLYMEDLSTKPTTHDVSSNHFSPTAVIGDFYPAVTKLWVINPQSGAGTCSEAKMSLPSGGTGSLLLGDEYLAENQLDSAALAYLDALSLSGDSTAAGLAAIGRLTAIEVELPVVGDPFYDGSLFALAIENDAAGDFELAAARRDSVLLVEATEYDSLRVEYDNLMALLLQESGSLDACAENDKEVIRNNLVSMRERLAGLVMDGGPDPQADPASGVPTSFALHPTFPNPFNASTTIQFDVPLKSNVNITVFDLLGRMVAQLVDQTFEAGTHKLIWDGRASSGVQLSTGMYFVRLNAPSFVQTQKTLLLK